MPIYEYQCLQCGRRMETMQKMADPPLTTCEVCGGALKKLVSSPAVQFKGSGWYVTDYARKGGGSSSSGSSKSEGESRSESDKRDKSESDKRDNRGGDSAAASGGGESKGDSKPAPESKSSDSKPKSD